MSIWPQGTVNLLKIATKRLSLEEIYGGVSGENIGVREDIKLYVVLSFLHRRAIFCMKLTMPTCGLKRPRVVRRWQEVTCQRCLGSIHAKRVQLQRQPSERPHAPQGHSPQSGEAPGQLQH